MGGVALDGASANGSSMNTTTGRSGGVALGTTGTIYGGSSFGAPGPRHGSEDRSGFSSVASGLTSASSSKPVFHPNAYSKPRARSPTGSVVSKATSKWSKPPAVRPTNPYHAHNILQC